MLCWRKATCLSQPPRTKISCHGSQLTLCEATTTSKREFCCKSKSHESNGIKAGKDLRMLWVSLSTTKLFMVLGRLSLEYYSPRHSRASKVTPSRWLSLKTMKKWRARARKRKKEKCWFCFIWSLEDFLPFHTPTPPRSLPPPASPDPSLFPYPPNFVSSSSFFQTVFQEKFWYRETWGPVGDYATC